MGFNANANKKAWRQYRRRVIQRYKTMRGCKLCGYKEHPAALHFDHRNPTEKSVTIGSVMHRWGLRKIAEEVAKCDVLCANCHAVKTATRKEHL